MDLDALATELRAQLAQRPSKPLDLPGMRGRASAVVVPLLEREGEPHLLFTQRSRALRHHGGQISFPGGARDEANPTPLHTALRETVEELGIRREELDVLGMLDETPTITQFRIVPFVCRLWNGVCCRPCADEVEALIEVPLASLLDPKVRRTGGEIDFYEHGAHVIWGATARILKNFLDVVEGLPTYQEHLSR